jgi:hypothetical protein
MLPEAGCAYGRDWVLPDGDDVIVVARRPMAGWEVTKYRKTEILFEGRRWYVAAYGAPAARATDPARGVGHRYRLSPWPEDLYDLPAHTFDYDVHEVDTREQAHRAGLSQVGVWLLLVPLYPVFGFLPSNAKARLEAGLGVSARATTRLSLRIEYITALSFIGMVVPEIIFDDLFGIPVWVLLLVGLGSLLDFVMRWDRANEEHRWQYGALEWAFRRLDSRRAARLAQPGDSPARR